jgi:hypothetical protein
VDGWIDGVTLSDWLMKNRMTLIAVLVILLYAGFIEWIWGWRSILSQWREIGLWPVLAAVGLLVSTQFIRTHRMLD